MHKLLSPVILLSSLMLLMACSPVTQPTATQPPPTATTAPEPTATATPVPEASIYVFSDTSPHIIEIDAETHDIIRTSDIPEMASKWMWMDPDNHRQGNILWGGTIDTDTGENSRVLTIDLDTLGVTDSIDLGPEKSWFYIGKPTQDGRLLVGIHGLWKVAFIDTATHEILKIVDVPVNAGDSGTPPAWATCDMDVSIGPDGIERAFYPTLSGNTVVSLDTKTGEVLVEVPDPDARPVMLTAAPNGTVWVQEGQTQTNAIYDPITLDVLARVPTGAGPVLASFSPDGKIGYISNAGDTTVTVVDAETYQVLREVEVGANVRMTAPHPNGKLVYVILTKENAVAVLDTSTWEVVKRIDLGTVPAGIHVRPK